MDLESKLAVINTCLPYMRLEHILRFLENNKHSHFVLVFKNGKPISIFTEHRFYKLARDLPIELSSKLKMHKLAYNCAPLNANICEYTI